MPWSDKQEEFYRKQAKEIWRLAMLKATARKTSITLRNAMATATMSVTVPVRFAEYSNPKDISLMYTLRIGNDQMLHQETWEVSTIGHFRAPAKFFSKHKVQVNEIGYIDLMTKGLHRLVAKVPCRFAMPSAIYPSLYYRFSVDPENKNALIMRRLIRSDSKHLSKAA